MGLHYWHAMRLVVLPQALKVSIPPLVNISLGFFQDTTLVTIIGAIMYVVEGPANGFTSIPTSIYWAIVTLTTVGYGDIAPKTGLGKALASLAMILGYGIIAVPTGIVTAGIAREQARRDGTRVCTTCGLIGHDGDARHCRRCGAALPTPDAET